MAAPRTASFRQQQTKGDYGNLAAGSEIRSSPSSPHELSAQEISTRSEAVAAVKGVQSNNSLIIAVSSGDISPTASSPVSQSTQSQGNSEGEVSPPVVQKKLAVKNKEALEAIRKSLSNKLINSAPPARVVQSIKASNGGHAEYLTGKPPAERKTSNSFEEARSALEESLLFGRHETGRAPAPPPASKRIAPPPPEEEEQKEPAAPAEVQDNTPSKQEAIINENPEVTLEKATPATVPTTPKLTPAIRHSSMKSELSNKSRDSKPRTVQFSPDTLTVTVPAIERIPKVISYNRWMGKGPNPYLESSFTGQPIAMLPPGAISQATKKPMVNYPTPPVMDDPPRKWTEKKKKWRSKSTPRSSEIDELMGSSKTKTSNRLAIFSSSSPGPVRRQSRVEIYEAEKRVQKKGKFWLKNLFKNQQEVLGGSESNLPNKFIDKEHEREILERQGRGGKARPEIIHPLDLLNGGVEVVKITPKKNSIKLDKVKLAVATDKAMQREELKTRIDVEGKDSGHDTSSIHTETSEDTGTSTGDFSSSSNEYSTNLSPIGMVLQVGDVYVIIVFLPLTHIILLVTRGNVI